MLLDAPEVLGFHSGAPSSVVPRAYLDAGRGGGDGLIRPGQRPRMHRHGSFHVKHRVPSPCLRSSVRPRSREAFHSSNGRCDPSQPRGATRGPSARASLSLHGQWPGNRPSPLFRFLRKFSGSKKRPGFAAAIRPGRVGEPASRSPSGRSGMWHTTRARRRPKDNIRRASGHTLSSVDGPSWRPGRHRDSCMTSALA